MAVRKRIDWRAVATAFAARVPHGVLHPGAMLTALADYERESRRGRRGPARWALAFSGGPDSLALLLTFWAEAPGRWGRKFVVLHFNHRLRGKAADRDETFCADVCRSLGVTFVAGRWAQARRGASEAEARTARLDFFHREMRRRKIRLLWLGHQQDDIAESMLMRLARGSGAAGLAAPRPAQRLPDDLWHLRPLLSLKKEDIVQALRGAGAVWRDDATNAGSDFFRNRVRHEVVPAWTKAAGRDALAGAALSRSLLEEDDHALEQWVDETRALAKRGKLSLAALRGIPRAVARRALRRWLAAEPRAGDLSRQAFESLLAAVGRGLDTRQSLGNEGFAVIKDGLLRFEPIGTSRRRFQRRPN